ncbi:unnamed protein product [Spirodela intermedia]|uniref:Uncharacterized protein n=1 Tax=Spirodela intermedia TaxID=51605 RepID=A0A7I8J469_SPIIN|nr:unnamed protein product [Spirodela intermedia]CAA6665017.1 unnamed protein product [Spirodela intermedia]
METLRKLERVQGMLSFMQARGISSGQSNSDRFLAEFLLFLIQPRSINLEKACHLVNEHLAKVEVEMFTDADFYEENCAEFPAEIGFPLIGLHAMQRANSTLEDFCRSYFMFHGMEAKDPHSIFRFLPVLSFTESYIYQLDIINEKSLCLSVDEENRSGKSIGNQTNILSEFKFISFDPLIFFLEQHGLLTERIKRELELGLEYWSLERKLCQSLTSKTKILLEDVMKAMRLKSFDYRVLHLLLYQLRDEQVNELHMEFLSVSEFLVEISDDLYDYEDDVIENSFNILRMFAKLYGPQMAPSMLAKCISELEDQYERLLRELDSDLSAKYQRRCEEATIEDIYCLPHILINHICNFRGKTSGYTIGTWNIPSIIADEDSYRSQIMNSNVSAQLN